MIVLLTGATGLVGTRLLPRLLAEGVECRALVRGDKVLPEGAIAVQADLFDTDALGSAVRGVDAIVHLAATFRTTDTDLIWNSNLDGSALPHNSSPSPRAARAVHHGQHRLDL